jgi:hypothetical protein
MSFLYPATLSLLGLLLPIIALYLLRMPRRHLRVPEIAVARLLVTDAKKLKRNSRTLISLALQVAILACLALGAAAPFAGLINGEGKRYIVVVDVSASMLCNDAAEFRVLADTEAAPSTGATRFQEAVAAVRGIANRLNRVDQLMLITAGSAAEVVLNFESEPNLIGAAIGHLQATAETGKFSEGCRLAAAAAKSFEGCEIYAITDAAVSDADLKPLADLGDKAVCHLVKIGKPSGNLGITGFSARKNLDSPTDYEALVTLVNTFDEDKTVDVELLQDGSLINNDAGKVIPTGGTAASVFKQKLRVGGVLQARVRVVDALAGDNDANEILLPHRRLRVLLVSPDDDNDKAPVYMALSTNSTSVMPSCMSPEKFKTEILDRGPEAVKALPKNFDAIIFDRSIPDSAQNIPDCHLLCIDCIPVTVPVNQDKDNESPLIRKWDRGHPTMSYMNLRNLFISKARTLKIGAIDKGMPPIENVADLISSPLIVSWERPLSDGSTDTDKPVANQRIVCVGFNPLNSDIVLRKEMPLLIWNSCAWFQTRSEPKTQTKAGSSIALPTPDDAGIAVTDPAGFAELVTVDRARAQAVFAKTSAPGVYRYATDGQDGQFAVNVASLQESDLRNPGAPASSIAEVGADTLVSTVTIDRRLWPYLWWIAAALLAFEAFVYHRRIFF